VSKEAPRFEASLVPLKPSCPKVIGAGIATCGGVAPKRFVYILKSITTPATYYVGVTSNIEYRLQAHNAGLSPHTARHRPWRRLVVIEFDDEQPAIEFERYLKTGSGREFARRHFRQKVSR
jgi:predicted GIY-YIG superfamily endonuclease